MITAKGKRVAFLCASGSKGGTEQLVRLLAGGLATRGADATVFALDSGNAQWLGERGAPVRTVQVMGQGKLVGTLRLAAALRPWRNAVINIHYPTFDVYRSHFASIKLAGCRNVVATLQHPHLQDKSRVLAVRQETDRCRSVLFLTPETKKIAEELKIVDPGKAVVCLPGIEPPIPYDSDKAKRELGIPSNLIVVSTMCRLAQEKRVPLLIDAVSAASQTGNLLLAIGGDGPERAKIEAYGKAKLGDRFKMLGYVQNSNMLYAASDIYAMLSDLEGFGLAFVEAGAHGVLSIGCSGGGIASAIEDGKTGYIVNVDDPVQAAANRISDLASSPDLRMKLGEAARYHYESNYTLESAIDRYQAVLFGNPTGVV